MKKTTRMLVAATGATVLLGIGLACSGIPGMPGGSYENVKVCKTYVEKYNKLDCIPDAAKLKPGDMCPETLDMTPCDLSEFYGCMTEAVKCKDGVPDLAGQAECGAPTCG